MTDNVQNPPGANFGNLLQFLGQFTPAMNRPRGQALALARPTRWRAAFSVRQAAVSCNTPRAS